MSKSVGQRELRYDGLGHVTGRTTFVNDIKLPGMLVAKALRSPVPRARILHLDVEEAKKVRGVYAVITGKDVPNNFYGFYPDQPVLTDQDIRYIGQTIAAVAAVDADAALEALYKIKLELEVLEPITDPLEAMKPDAPQIRPEGNMYQFDNGTNARTLRLGNVDEAFEKADCIVSGVYNTPPQEHAMLETNCTVVDVDSNGRLLVYTESQGLAFHHGSMASVLQLPFNKINMIGGTVGGGFGGRNDIHSDHITALLALKTQKPVKWLWTREEEMLCSNLRGAWRFEFQDGVQKNGKITARKIKIIHDTGGYAGFGPYAVDKSVFTIAGPYAIPNVWIDGHCVFTNKSVAGSMRGFGINVGQFAEEVQMDKISHKLGISPWELRFKNAWKEGNPSATRQVMRAVSLIETLQEVARLSDTELPEECWAMSSKQGGASK